MQQTSNVRVIPILERSEPEVASFTVQLWDYQLLEKLRPVIKAQQEEAIWPVLEAAENAVKVLKIILQAHTVGAKLTKKDLILINTVTSELELAVQGVHENEADIVH